MEQAMAVFNFNEYAVRTVAGKDGELWFVAKDVCDILEISRHRDAVNGLDDDERGRLKVDTLGGTQDLLSLSESGLYTLIIRSNKPNAKKFRRWVTKEVLPAIRKTGGYNLCEIADDPEDMAPISGPAAITVARLTEAAQGVKSAMQMARAFGYKGDMAKRLANDVVYEITGVNALELLKLPEPKIKVIEPLVEIESVGLPLTDGFMPTGMLDDFIAEACVLDKMARCRARDLYHEFLVWLKGSGRPYDALPSQRFFGSRLTGRVPRVKSGGRIIYLGLKLKTAAVTA